MAGVAQAAPKQTNDSGPSALNPGVSGAAPLIKEAWFLNLENLIRLAWGDIRSLGEPSGFVLARLWRSAQAQESEFCRTLTFSQLFTPTPSQTLPAAGIQGRNAIVVGCRQPPEIERCWTARH